MMPTGYLTNKQAVNCFVAFSFSFKTGNPFPFQDECRKWKDHFILPTIDNQVLTPVWEVMEANYMFNLSIAGFARLAQRSEATFKRDFFAWYQTTPGKRLTQKRLEYAKLLLSTSNKNVNEIAYESGFENLSHFSRIFKDKYG